MQHTSTSSMSSGSRLRVYFIEIWARGGSTTTAGGDRRASSKEKRATHDLHGARPSRFVRTGKGWECSVCEPVTRRRLPFSLRGGRTTCTQLLRWQRAGPGSIFLHRRKRGRCPCRCRRSPLPITGGGGSRDTCAIAYAWSHGDTWAHGSH